MADIEPGVLKAKEHILATSTLNENGTRTSTKAAYLDFCKDLGIPKAQVQAVGDADADYCSAAVHVAADDLAPKIAAAKNAGEDPSELEAEVRLPTNNGRIVAVVKAQNTVRIPQTGETVTRHGSTKLSISLGSAVKKPAAEYARDTITAAMAAKAKK